MQAKESISDEDINDMIQEYKCLYVSEEKETINNDEDCQIVYKGKWIYFKIFWNFSSDFIAMLQQ